MNHLLDTNCCIEHLRRGSASSVAIKLASVPPGSVALCTVVVAELLYGAWRSANSVAALQQVRVFCAPFIALSFDSHAAEEYGQIRARLATAGKIIGPNDLMIASIALANKLTLVTHNTAEFSRVPGLITEDWQLP